MSPAARLALGVGAVLPVAALLRDPPPPIVTGFLVGVAVLAAVPVWRGGGPLWWRAGAAASTALFCAAAIELPPEVLEQPLLAQARGQGPLVGARAALLCAGLLLLRLLPRRRRELYAFVLAAGLVVSWMVQLGLLALAGAWLVIATRARAPFSRERPAFANAAVALCLAGAVALVVAPGEPPPPASHEEAARYWLERDNPWRALPHARAWAAGKGPPGAGVVTLAQVAARLGDDDDARHLLSRVTPSSLDPATRARADALYRRLTAR